jgi:uracil-DNA glycosylase
MTDKGPPMDPLVALLEDIRRCRVCVAALPLGPRPVVQISRTATLLIIGQAPGTRVHETGVPWNDASGIRLRAWMGLDTATFYNPAHVAIMPMGFCYPGVDKKGGDKPPRPDCAPLWHQPLRAHLSNIRLTLLVGRYAQRAYLPRCSSMSMTVAVRAFQSAPSDVMPLPHPSWRTVGWQKRNPWFDADLLPVLRARVSAAVVSRNP